MYRLRSCTGFRVALLAIGFVSLAASAMSPMVAAAEPGPNARAVERVMNVQDRHTGRLMALPGVVGTATGLNPAGKPVVKVFVARTGVAGIPANLEGVPVSVEVTGEFIAMGDTTAKYRPAPIGVSTGHPDITAGTIGCRVTDGANVYALSNNHVYADENLATNGDVVLQPGAYDGGRVGFDEIGTLHDFVELSFDPSAAPNTMDAAIAISDEDSLDNKTLADGYGTPSSTPYVPVDELGSVDILLVGVNVQKYGRTTSLTHGYVAAINANVNVGYSRGTAYFEDQIIAQAYEGKFIQGGDSGSLMVTDPGKQPVGLLFAGPRSGRYGIANRIDLVLAHFGVTVDDTASEPTNVPPTADFTYTASDLTVGFTDLSSDSDGTVVGWNWVLGDGNTSTDQNPWHTYAEPGTYTVSLTVTDDGGETDSTSKEVTVPVAGVAVVEVDPNTGNPGQTLDVAVGGTGFQEGAIVDFGERIAVQAITFGSPTELAVRIKIHPRAASGVRDVTVINPDGTSAVYEAGFEVL